MTPRKLRCFRQFCQGERLGKVVLHFLYQPDDRRINLLHARCKRKPLAVGRLPYTIDKRALAHRRHDGVAAIVLHNVEHHVDCGGASGTSVHAAIHDVETGAHKRTPKPLDEAGIVFPMDGAFPAVQQSRTREDVGAVAEARDFHTALPAFPQPRCRRNVCVLLDIPPPADDSHEGPLRVGKMSPLRSERIVDLDRQAAACFDLRAISGD